MMRYLIALLFVFAPFSASAQVVMTEIMYSVEGADGGREWIEVHNTGNSSIDLSSWRLFENDSNHYIRREAGGELAAGEYAIIADDPDAFAGDYPDVSTQVFDSAFSLRNTGETLILRDGELEDKDSVSYDPAWGADGDGDSLQLVNGEWTAAAPTPGGANTEEDEPEQDKQDGTNTDDDSDAVSDPPPVFQPEKSISVVLSRVPETIIAGAGARLEAQAYGFENEPLDGARYLWSFGDGAHTEEKRPSHAYAYPGEYIVSVNASSGKYAAYDRATVSVIPADIAISDIGGAHDFYIEVANKTGYELDVSRWMLAAGEDRFPIPDDTYLMPDVAVRFAPTITGLSRPQHVCKDTIALLYPNGKTATEYDCPPASPSVGGGVVKKRTHTPTQSEPRRVKQAAPPVRQELSREKETNNVQDKEALIAKTQSGSAHADTGSDNDISLGWWLLGTGVLAAVGVAGVVVAGGGNEQRKIHANGFGHVESGLSAGSRDEDSTKRGDFHEGEVSWDEDPRIDKVSVELQRKNNEKDRPL